MNKKVLVCCFLLIATSSCDPNRLFEENIDFDDAQWTIDNVPQFTFEIKDAAIPYNLDVNIRNAISYPFHNIYLKYNLRDSTGTALMSELKEYYLFDAKTGEPLGDGLGDIFDNRFSLKEDYSFPATGRYSIDLQQFMRLDSLPMILSVGVRVEKGE